MGSLHYPQTGTIPARGITVPDVTDDPDVPRDIRTLVDSLYYRDRVDRWAIHGHNHANRALTTGANSMTGIAPPAGKIIPAQSMVQITYSVDLHTLTNASTYATIEIRNEAGSALIEKQVNLSPPGYVWASPSLTLYYSPPAQTNRFSIYIVAAGSAWEVRSQSWSAMCMY